MGDEEGVIVEDVVEGGVEDAEEEVEGGGVDVEVVGDFEEVGDDGEEAVEDVGVGALLGIGGDGLRMEER